MLKNKKLLILGGAPGEISLVKRAQSMGIYTIVTDHYLDRAVSPAKNIADEAWDISWTAYDELEKMCRQHHVDGITAGYSEFKIEALIELCERLNLPCYCSKEQLAITRDKIKFKEACRDNGVPVVQDYVIPDEVRRFPVIVKPTDRAGSIGISIASNQEELKKAYDYAMEMSASKRVIIEDYISDSEGTKFDVYYGITDGKIEELTTCDTINADENGTSRVVQSCWLYPSRVHDIFHKTVDKALRNMIQHMGIQYGCIFFSGFVNSQSEFSFFECGFRMEGAHQYEYVSKRGPYHFLDIFILHALTGSTALLKRHQIDDDLKCVDVNVFGKKGILSQLCGMKEITAMDDCCLMLQRAHLGQICRDDFAILSKIVQFAFCSHDVARLEADVEKAYHSLKVLDENGENMAYGRVDSKKILGWWE